jgi:hypothetical protein
MSRPTKENKVRWEDLSEELKQDILKEHPLIPDSFWALSHDSGYFWYENGDWWIDIV